MLKVLVAPLDWGLGHATRCIPIIKELINQGCTVIIAASGLQKTLLQEEFPTIRLVEIPGYRVKYGKNRAFTVLRLMASIPKILICVKQENQWFSRFARQEQPDVVLSDNRYGLYRKGIVCVFITHQLAIRTPFGTVADWLLQRIIYSAIRHFSCCWVPDIPGPDSLAGKLSHPRKMPLIPTRYIGWLSRFGAVAPEVTDIDYDLLVLLSGPEPQRTILEKAILEQAAAVDGKMVLVRGWPEAPALPTIPINCQVYDHLPAAELEPLIRRSAIVLSRPGYSTVMDLVRLQRRAIFVPTPGQTEQEYLGSYLFQRGLACCMPQRQFSLRAALAAAHSFSFRLPEEKRNDLLKAAIAELLAAL